VDYSLLLSNDDGATWRAAPTVYAPINEVVNYCGHSMFMVGARLFLGAIWSNLSPGQPVRDFNESLARSEDGGRHWQAISGDSARFLSGRPTVLTDGTIITTPWPTSREASEDQSVLWTSADEGDTLRPFTVLRGISSQRVIAPFGALTARRDTSHPLYLSFAESIPSRLLLMRVAQITDDRHWAYLPPLPAPGTSGEHVGVMSILGETASGKLLVYGVSPTSGVVAARIPDEDFPQQWLWSWDPREARWTSLGPPLPVAWKTCSDHCWQASFSRGAAGQRTVLWVRGYVSEDGGDDLYRLSLPAEIA
jgi:hypothetical protein